MYIGGNLGMGLGMFAGGWLVAQIGVGSIAAAGFSSFLGMTIGMVVGMTIGTATAVRLRATFADMKFLPVWLLRLYRTPH